MKRLSYENARKLRANPALFFATFKKNRNWLEMSGIEEISYFHNIQKGFSNIGSSISVRAEGSIVRILA
jgi:hypothetical protein